MGTHTAITDERSQRAARPPERPDEEAVATIAGGQHELRLAIMEVTGRFAIDLRVWRSGDDGVFRPTRHGLHVFRHQVNRLIDALRRAELAADEKTRAAINATTSKGPRP